MRYLKKRVFLLLIDLLLIGVVFSLAEASEGKRAILKRKAKDIENEVVRNKVITKKVGILERKNKLTFSLFGTLRTTAFLDYEKDSTREDRIASNSYVNLGAKGRFGKNFYYNIQGQMPYHLAWGEKTNRELEAYLDEAYIGLKVKGFDFRIGNQIFTWGKLDEIVILDILNPQDLRYYLTFEKQDRKIPVPSLNLKYYFDLAEGGVAELVWIPKFKPNKVKYFNSNWAPFDSIREAIRENVIYNAYTKEVVDNIDIIEKSYKWYRFDHSDAGLKVGLTLKNWDFDLYYLYKRDPEYILKEKDFYGLMAKSFIYQPTLQNLLRLVGSLPPTGSLTLRAEHPRMHILGLDAEGTIFTLGWRYEGGLFFDKHLLKNDFTITKKPLAIHGFGIDNQRTDLYLNIQFLHKFIMDYEPLYAQEKNSTQLSNQISWTSPYGKIKIGMDSIYNIVYDDYYLNPYLTYNNQKGLSLTGGCFVFKGDATTQFGTFDNSDYVYLDAKYEF